MQAARLLSNHRRTHQQMWAYLDAHEEEGEDAVEVVAHVLKRMRMHISYFSFMLRRFMRALKRIQRFCRTLRSRRESAMSRIVDVSKMPGIPRSLIYDVVYDEYSLQRQEYMRRWARWRQRCRYYECIDAPLDLREHFQSKEPLFRFRVNNADLHIRIQRRADSLRMSKVVAAMAKLGIRTNDVTFVRSLATECFPAAAVGSVHDRRKSQFLLSSSMRLGESGTWTDRPNRQPAPPPSLEGSVSSRRRTSVFIRSLRSSDPDVPQKVPKEKSEGSNRNVRRASSVRQRRWTVEM